MQSADGVRSDGRASLECEAKAICGNPAPPRPARRWRAGALAALLAVLPCAAAAQDYDLEIITPHNEHIQQEFEQAFVRHLGRPVRLRWIKQGTGQLISLLEAKDRAKKGASFDLDVFFGGGVPDHQLAAERGYLEKPNIPADVLAGIPPRIAGVDNYDRAGMWFGSALSSFGVLMNTRGLATQGLPEVQTWADLCKPEMFSWVVLADPRKSSSVRVSYELVLQQYGWEKGLPMLIQLGANARVIADASSIVPNEVASGNVLAGPCIDFYAYARVAENKETLKYVNPAGGSAITPDPISMLRKPPHRELAEKFIAFVLAPDGQRVWILPAGAPGGPKEHALYRLPVRPDVFPKDGAASDAIIRNPYDEAGKGVFRTLDGELQNARNVLLSELFGAAVVDQQSDARAAWKALIDGGMKPQAVAEWNKLPFDERESVELAKKVASGGREAKNLVRAWFQFYKRKYETVRKLAK